MRCAERARHAWTAPHRPPSRFKHSANMSRALELAVVVALTTLLTPAAAKLVQLELQPGEGRNLLQTSTTQCAAKVRPIRRVSAHPASPPAAHPPPTRPLAALAGPRRHLQRLRGASQCSICILASPGESGMLARRPLPTSVPRRVAVHLSAPRALCPTLHAPIKPCLAH